MISEHWSDHGLHQVTKATLKPLAVTEKNQQQILLEKASTFGLKTKCAPISTLAEWSDQSLMLEDDHSVLRKTVIEHLTEVSKTVSITPICP